MTSRWIYKELLLCAILIWAVYGEHARADSLQGPDSLVYSPYQTIEDRSMPDVRIISQTAAAESEPFSVRGYQLPMGVRSWGLAGTEEIAIHEDRGDGTFRALTETDSVLTETNDKTSIVASGRYKIVKPLTAGPSGASTD